MLPPNRQPFPDRHIYLSHIVQASTPYLDLVCVMHKIFLRDFPYRPENIDLIKGIEQPPWNIIVPDQKRTQDNASTENITKDLFPFPSLDQTVCGIDSKQNQQATGKFQGSRKNPCNRKQGIHRVIRTAFKQVLTPRSYNEQGEIHSRIVCGRRHATCHIHQRI